MEGLFGPVRPERSSAENLTWRWARQAGIAAAVGVAYFLAARLSNSFLITPETVIFWPAAGISSGVLISLWFTARWPVLVGVMAATAAANLLRHFGVGTTAVWVLGNTAEPLIIAGLIQHYFGAHFKIDRLNCVLGLLAAAVVGTVVASTWWTFVYYVLLATLKEPTATWLHWIVSDLAGIVSVAPLVIGIAAALRRPPARREVIESLVALAALGAMSGVIVSLPLELWNTVVPAALVFPILLWLAARSQPVFSAAGAFIVSMSVALTAIYGFGHFGDSGLSIGARVLQTQAIILGVTIGTAVLAALFAERRESEARLVRTNMMFERERNNRLMSLEAMAASIAHEMKQPLTAIAGNSAAVLALLQQASPDLDEIREAERDISTDAHRAGHVLDGIRALFQKIDRGRQPIDMNAIVAEVLQSLHGEFSEHGVRVHTDLSSDLPLVEGNANQLHQVISNLAHNAVEAMRATTEQERVLRLGTARVAPAAISVTVQDSGSGIDPKKLDGIFDAFVTTKSHGMGLGLAISRVIAERHGGELTASSDGKNGALFQMVLPVESMDRNTARPQAT